MATNRGNAARSLEPRKFRNRPQGTRRSGHSDISWEIRPPVSLDFNRGAFPGGFRPPDHPKNTIKQKLKSHVLA